MINKRALAIRFGLSRFWYFKAANSSFHSKIISIFFSEIVRDFFTDDYFVEYGIVYDSCSVQFYSDFADLNIFVQDSIFEEISYITRLSSFRAYRYFRFKRRQATNCSLNFQQKNFLVPSSIKFLKRLSLSVFLKKRFYLINLENFTKRLVKFSRFIKPLQARLYFFSSFRKFHILKKLKLSVKIKSLLKVKRLTSLQCSSGNRYTLFVSKRFIRSSFIKFSFKKPKFSKKRKHSIPRKHFFFKDRFDLHYEFFNFLVRFFSSFSFNKFFRVRTAKLYIIPYIAANVDSFIFYSAIRLHYKYILSDVIKPIIKGVAMYYQGFFVLCKGRFTRAQMASKKLFSKRFINYNRLHNPIYYSFKAVSLRYGASTVHI
jgi:hypothetical protein